MSIRPPQTTDRALSCGSLFGPAIGAPIDGLWSCLAVSPPRSPPLPMSYATPPPMFDLDLTSAHTVGAGAATAAARTTTTRTSEVPQLFGVCPTWVYTFDDEPHGRVTDAMLIIFDQDACTMTVQSVPRRIHNVDPVTAKTVPIWSVSWKLMCDNDGRAGHVFQLLNTNGIAAQIEVFTKHESTLDKVAIVQSSYHPLSMAAGVADASSLLVFENPENHLDSLKQVAQNLKTDGEIGYAPVSECCITHGFQKLSVHLGSKNVNTLEYASARAVWKSTKDFLSSLSTLTAECVDLYTSLELERAGATELKHMCRRWRANVV